MGLLVGLLIICAFLFLAASRRSSSSLKQKPQRLESLTTSKSVEDVIRLISSFASASGYKVSHFDPSRGEIVLEEGASAFSYGFFFPISISANGAAGTLVSIGIRSRAVQVGPVVGRSHDKVVSGIKAALF